MVRSGPRMKSCSPLGPCFIHDPLPPIGLLECSRGKRLPAHRVCSAHILEADSPRGGGFQERARRKQSNVRVRGVFPQIDNAEPNAGVRRSAIRPSTVPTVPPFARPMLPGLWSESNRNPSPVCPHHQFAFSNSQAVQFAPKVLSRAVAPKHPFHPGRRFRVSRPH